MQKHSIIFIGISAFLFFFAHASSYSAEVVFEVPKQHFRKTVGSVIHAEIKKIETDPTVVVEMSLEASNTLKHLTTQYAEETVRISVNGEVIYKGPVYEPIGHGGFQLSGSYTKAQAEKLLKLLLTE